VAEPPSRALPAPPGSVPAPKAVIAPAAPTPSQGRQAAEVRPAAGGAYKVQIAATRSDADARATWTRLQSANRDLLGSLALTVQQADLGERGIYYRIQAGGLADVQSAQSLCAALKSRRVDCMVVRP
jgi:cell division septation protein DedD